MTQALRQSIVTAATAFLLTLAAAQAGAAGFEAGYLYSLSDFSGTVPYFWAGIVPDNDQVETYVVSGNTVDVFDQNGMQVYEFAYDAGNLNDVAVFPDGDIMLLTNGSQLVRCDYRGEPKSTVGFSGFPPEFGARISFNRMVYHDGRLYLADFGNMRVVVVDTDGVFLQGYDISALLQLSEEETRDSGLNGFSVDDEGNILFVISASAKVAALSPDGTLSSFGKRGSGPGKFGVPAAIAADRMGNYLVADKLRCVILVFGKDHRYIKEFGYRGLGPGNLIVPHDIVVDARGRAYVAQLRARGVSVFQLRYP